MNPQRLAVLGASITISICVLYLLGWWALWRLLVTHPLPPPLFVMPLSAVLSIIAALGLLSAARDTPTTHPRAFSVVVIAIATIVLLEYLLSLTSGLERYVLGDPAEALLGGATPGRPAPQSALTLLFLGLALWYLGRPRPYRFDFADLGIGMALFLSCTTLLGHLYEARALYQSAGGGAVGMSLVETLLLILLSFSALCLNPQGVVASWSADDAAGAAKRRLIPAILLTPVLLGLLEYYAVKYGALEFSLALALAVTANIVVFMALAEWISRLLVKIEEERTGHFVKRESQAKAEGMTDMLTQLLNRRGWDQAVRQCEERCQREGLNAAVIVIDLDGLKRINDTQGHAKGDEFIRRAGTALKSASRREDFLARLGGDEFAYLSVGCAPEHAGVVLKRLSQALNKATVPASLGFAMRDMSGSIAGAFQEADESMYKHKRARKAQAQTPGATAA
jgi:diguanylate cyclase (GGDEF)-like protein